MNQPVPPSSGSSQPPAAANSAPPGPAPTFEAAFATHPGMARDHNEDAIWVTPADHPRAAARGRLVIVADGMGGHNAGEVASQAAVRGVFDRYYADNEADVHRSLDNAVRRTNAELHNQAQANPAQRGMGTTLTAAVIRGNRVYWAHVGDSRLYLIRGGQIEQLTSDHSWVEEQVRAGVLTRLQAESHPQRNVITRALATNPDVKVDHGDRELAASDVLLLCSDGLNTEVGDAQMAAHATKAATLKDAVDRLIQLANDNGGEDNISVAVMRVASEAATLAGAGIVVGPDAAPRRRFRPLIMAAAGVLGLVALALVGVLVVLPLVKPPQAQVEPTPAPPVAQAVQPTATLAQGVGTQPVRETPGGVVPLAPSATLQPTDINTEPTATLAPIAAPTNTAAPRLATATPQAGRGGITPTASSRRVPPPVLKDPDGATVPGRTTFSWDTGGYGLGFGEGYALLAWKADDPKYQGKSGLDLPSLFDACARPYVGLSADGDPGATSGPGDYNWTVVVVDTNRRDAFGRCVVISDQPGPHRFTYAVMSTPQETIEPATPTPVPPPP